MNTMNYNQFQQKHPINILIKLPFQSDTITRAPAWVFSPRFKENLLHYFSVSLNVVSSVKHTHFKRLTFKSSPFSQGLQLVFRGEQQIHAQRKRWCFDWWWLLVITVVCKWGKTAIPKILPFQLRSMENKVTRKVGASDSSTNYRPFTLSNSMAAHRSNGSFIFTIYLFFSYLSSGIWGMDTGF